MASDSFEDPFMQSILEKIAKEENFKQPKFSVSWGSRPGDNYTGRIYRAVIAEADSETKPLSLIFKASPLSKARQESTNTNALFRTEADMYQTVLPTLNNILNKYGVIKSDAFPGTVRCFAVHLEDTTKVIVLEDKSTEGFGRLNESSKSFDTDHCRKILKNIALLHAAYFALAHHEPETAQRLRTLLAKDFFFDDIKSTVLKEMKQSCQEALALLQEPFPKGSELYEKLEHIVENYENNMAAANKTPLDLPTIIHGDCWFNNILYKYNKDGSLQDICLIDFQASRMGSPALDLSYLIFVCTTKEMRDSSYDDIIRFYHNEVSSLLRMMDCNPEKIFPWTLLEEHLRKHSKLGVLVAFAALRVCLLDSSDNKVNLQVEDDDDTIFVGKAGTTNPEKIKEISKRTTDVITDALRLGYI